MDLVYFLRVLLRKKWLIILSAVLGVILGVIFTMFQKKTYISLAQYTTGFTQTQKVSLSLNEGLDVNQIDSRFSNVIETFQSPTVLGMLSYDLLLHDLESTSPFRMLTENQKKDTSYQKANIEKIKKILHEKLKEMQLLTRYDLEERKAADLVGLYHYDEYTISKKITVERIPHTDYLNVTFVSENPELSAYLVNTIGIKFKEFYTSLTSTRTKESLSKLDSLATSKKKQVDSLRKKYENFRSSIGTPNISDKATAAMQAVQEMTSSLTTEESKSNLLTAQLNSVDEQLKTINLVSTTPTRVETNNNEELLSLKEKNKTLYAQLAQKGGTDPDIEGKIQDNIKKIVALTPASTLPTTNNSAQKAIDKKEELQKKKIDLNADLAASKQNADLLRSRLAGFTAIANSGGGAEAIANAMQNDLNFAQKDLDKYNNSIFASQDIDVAPDMNFKQTLTGQPPIQPETRHRTLVVGIAGISMLFISSLLILMLEFLDTSLRTPTFFMKETNMKLLTTINKINLQDKQLKDYFDTSNQNERSSYSNFFIESLRKLRFELENSGKKVILITSLKPKEGKSVILESLARTFSMSKKKILIIDSNFSDNSLTRTFGAKATLENFNLSAQENAIDKIWGITTLTNISNTDIIGCNEGNYTPSEVLPKNNLLLNINKISQHYDFILIEGAALNTHADSKELSKYVEGIIAVFSSKDVIGEVDRESLQFLKTGVGNKFIGAILNSVREDLLNV